LGGDCDDGAHTCTENEDCFDIPNGFLCTCKDGFELTGLGCEDVNECENGDANCDANADCINSSGDFSCVCKTGFFGSGTFCEDDDECFFDPCDENANCTNSIGSFDCACKNDFWEGNGFICTDADECTAGTHDCNQYANCTNVELGWECECLDGFTTDGNDCNDIDECADETDDCAENSTCENEPGSFKCVCDQGYEKDGNDTCVDVDECDLELDDCDSNADCVNSASSFECVCQVGWEGDGRTCYDVDECTTNAVRNHSCTETEICQNSVGGYDCAPIDCDSIQNSAAVRCDYKGMVISFPKCVYQNFSLAGFYLDGPVASSGENASDHCFVQNSDDGDIWFDWVVENDNDMCGTVLTNNGTHAIYDNAVQKSSNEGSNSVISRKTGTLIQFTCTYELSMEVSLRTGVNVKSTMAEVRIGAKSGTMKLTSAMFKDQLFAEIMEPETIVIVPNEMYFGISMESWDSSLQIMLQKCWATPTSNPRNSLKYQFLDDFCGDYYEEHVFKTLEIFQNGGSTQAKMSLQSFTWNNQDASVLHFHCLVAICDSDEEVCEPDCSLRKRRAGRKYRSKYISLGTAYVSMP